MRNGALITAVSALSVIGSTWSMGAAAAESRLSMTESRAVFAEAAAACPDTLEEQQAIFAELFSSGEPTLEDWAQALNAYLSLAEAGVTCIESIEPPDKLLRVHHDFLEAIDVYLSMQREAADAAAAGDAASFQELAGESQGRVKREVIRTARLLGIGDWFA